MHLAHPALLLLLLLVPLLVIGAVLAARSRKSAWQRLVAARLRPLLITSRRRRLRHISFALSLAAFTLVIISLAAPNAGYRETQEILRGRNLLIAIDVSRSMLADDEHPNRFGAARTSALEILERFPHDRIGVIAFSGVAWLAAPLTVDHGALRETLEQLDFMGQQEEWMPQGGSDLAKAVNLAVETFEDSERESAALIILSDGEHHEESLKDAAENADEAGVTIFTVGFGSEEGAFIPDPNQRDGKLHDRDGNLVLTRLDNESLDLLARRSGGFYMAGSARNFASNLERAVQQLNQFEVEGGKRSVLIPRFQWFLFPAILLFVMAMLLNTTWRPRRSTAATAVLLAFLAFSPGSEARLIPRTEAEGAYNDGDYARALELFEREIASARGERKARLHLGEGAAAYRLGDYRRSLRAYSEALLSEERAVQEQAYYGLGNTHFLRGEHFLKPSEEQKAPSAEAMKAATLFWEDSLQHFDHTLALNPDNQNARHNRDLVKKRLDELKKRQEQQPNDPEQNPNDNPNEDPNKDPNQDPSENPNNNPNQDPNQDPEQNPDRDPNQNPEQDPDQDPDKGPNEDPNQSPNENPNSEAQPNQTAENSGERPEESPEDYARRILSDNADLRVRPAPLRLRNIRPPEKNW